MDIKLYRRRRRKQWIDWLSYWSYRRTRTVQYLWSAAESASVDWCTQIHSLSSPHSVDPETSLSTHTHTHTHTHTNVLRWHNNVVIAPMAARRYARSSRPRWPCRRYSHLANACEKKEIFSAHRFRSLANIVANGYADQLPVGSTSGTDRWTDGQTNKRSTALPNGPAVWRRRGSES